MNKTTRFQVRSRIYGCGEAIECTYGTREEAQRHADRIVGRMCHTAWVVEVQS